MAKKTQSPLKNDYRVYVTQASGYIAGEEVIRDDAVAVLGILDPVFITGSADGTGFDLKPVQFIAPGVVMRLYTYGLLGDAPMPDGLLPWFQKYQAQRSRQGENQP